ncbi:MAG: replication factor small subunit, partial [Euryarchaeota archaeon]|nr:replication factor small subunit [Euryarchaeota archaeon]
MEDSKIKEEIWIEKYRPVRLHQVAGQDETIERLMS